MRHARLVITMTEGIVKRKIVEQAMNGIHEADCSDRGTWEVAEVKRLAMGRYGLMTQTDKEISSKSFI